MTEHAEAARAVGLKDAPRTPERADAPAVRPSRRAVALGLVRSARPRQWTKNVLLLAAPGAAGVLDQADALGKVAIAVVAFCVLASGTYLLNDVRDAEADRLHPSKRARPIAAGVVSPALAVVVGVVLLLAGLGLSAAVGWQLLAVAVTYLALTSAYTMWLRHVAVLDIATVAGFFIIRAVAGGVAVDVPLSRWFLIVASFGSLFIVVGKRAGEHLELGEDRAGARSTLAVYSLEYLRFVRTMAAGVTVTAYLLWAFGQSTTDDTAKFLFAVSGIPFVLFILRYALLLETGRGSAPEELVLRDRALLALSLLWVIVFGAGVAVAR
jgi:decaprenyl-phosphate phosphoribosyltransferase